MVNHSNNDQNDIVANLTDRSFWYRALCMLLFGFIFYLVETAVLVLAIFQVIYKVFTGEPNAQVLAISKDLALYINQLVNYLLFNSEEQPFPIGEWPSGSPSPPTHSSYGGSETSGRSPSGHQSHQASAKRAGARTTVENADDAPASAKDEFKSESKFKPKPKSQSGNDSTKPS